MSLKKPVFVTDIDGVLLDFEGAVRRWFSTYYEKEVAPSTMWEFEHSFGVPKGVVIQMWSEIWDSPLSPLPHAKWFLEEIKARGFHLRALSKRPKPAGVEASMRDLKAAGLVDLFNGIHFQEHGESKGDILRYWKATYFIDDSFANIYDSLEESPKTFNFLMDAPYNQSQDIAPPYKRVHTFQEVFNYLDDPEYQ